MQIYFEVRGIWCSFVLMNAEKKDIIIYVNNGRRMSSQEALKQYGIVGIHSTIHALNYCELYSGGDKDPITWARLDSERFAVDVCGNKLPYDVTVSFRALKFNDRDLRSLYLMSRNCRRLIMNTQALVVHVVVFKDEEHKRVYDMANACFIKEY